MSQQYINIGATPNDGLGDPIRTAFQKTNDNFSQLFPLANVITITGNGISVTGNISGNYFIGNGSQLTGITASANTGNVTFSNTTIITPPTALANLTPVAGGRAFINNGNLVAVGNFGAQVGNGGSNIVPVWSDGTNWYIG